MRVGRWCLLAGAEHSPAGSGGWGALWACGNTAERKGECVYNSIFSLIVFPFLSFLDNWIDKPDEARVVELEKMFFG